MKDCKIWMFLCVLCLVIGFFAGRKTIDTKEMVRYVQGETITGSVDLPQPVESIPENPTLPMKSDTIIEYVVQVVDTAAIIADYIIRREYTPILFDNPTIGKLSLSTTVQYNKIIGLNYEFIPIVKEITRYKVHVWQPYVSGYGNTFGQIGLGLGLFRYNVGVEAMYLRDLKNQQTGYGVGIKYKF